ncbi:MAG: TolC family protein, partial [Pseudomonadota bacterium]
MKLVVLALAALWMTLSPIGAIAQNDTDGQSLAQDVALPLLPADVLESSATRFPDILESLAREAAARGDQLAAEGAFDLVFNADGFDRVSGFWTGGVVNTELQQNLRPFGAQVYGGYR